MAERYDYDRERERGYDRERGREGEWGRREGERRYDWGREGRAGEREEWGRERRDIGEPWREYNPREGRYGERGEWGRERRGFEEYPRERGWGEGREPGWGEGRHAWDRDREAWQRERQTGYAGGERGWGGYYGGGRESYYGGTGAYGGGMGEYGERGRYAGRGPKGYQRSDDRIREDICERLTRDPDIDASEIEVQVRSAEVTLTGTVDERDAKRRAEDLVEDVSGVRDVHNQIRVQSRTTAGQQQSR